MRNLLLILFAFLAYSAKAQDPEFTQFYVNSMYLNPAMVGSSTCPIATSMYRNQWPAISGEFISTSVSYDDYVSDISGGIGIMFMSDKAGPSILSTTGVSLAYSNHTRLSRDWFLRTAMQVSAYQEYLDDSKFRFNDQIDPNQGFVLPTQDFYTVYIEPVSYVSFGSGMVLFSDNFYVGYAANHLNTPNKSLISGESQLPVKHTFHTGAVLPTNKSVELYPSLVFRKQADFQQMNTGININSNALISGVWYRGIWFLDRYTDAFIISLGLKLEDFNFMYSYDLTLSQLTLSSGGSHEVSLMYKFPCRNKRNKVRSVPCTWDFN